MTFQSDNGTAFVGELTKELMRRSQVAQAHSTTYHPQTNGLVERQNRTLVSMLRVYCSRYMTDWDRYLPQVMGAYNSTQHSTTGVSPHMMLTGHEKSLPLTFFYPEYEGKKTSPQVYVRDVIRRQQELNDLCRRNTQQAQARQRKRFDKKAAGAKAYSVGDYVWVFQNIIPPKGTKKLLKKWRGPFMITEVHQEGRFYRLSTGRAAHYENIKPHNPSTEDWCIPADMEEGDYLMMDPACEVNEKGTREKNDGNEVVEEGTDTPLDLDPNEQIEVDDETLPYAEEDWQDPEQIEVPKNLEPDLPFTIQTRQKDGMRPRKKYNPYGDDFVVDRIDLKKLVEEVVGLEEITVSQDIDIVDDHDNEWVDDWSKPEVEFDDEQQQSYEQDLTNLRVLEWLNETTSDPEETSVTIQDVDRESMKYIKTERDDPSWAAQEGRLLIPASNLDLIPGMRSTGTSMDIFVRGVGVGLTHTENLIIKKLRIARETGDLEAETGEEPKKPDIGKIQSIISVAGHQVIRNLSEPSEFTLMHLDTYADYLRQVEPRTESRAVRALLTTGGPRMKKLHGRYLEVYGPYQVMLNVDGISIYTRTYVTTDDDQMGQIYLGEEEFKVRRIGHDAMMEQDAVHIGYEADVTAHLLDTNGTKIGVTGLLDTGAVVSVMPIKTWERMGFTREDLIPTNLRLAAANRGAIYVAGRTPITVLHMGGRDLWMSFLVVENLDDADQFILGRDFVRNFDVMIDLNNGLIRIRNPDRKYVKKPINRIITDENKVPIFLDRKVKLQPGQAVVAIFRMRNLNSLSDSKQVCLVPNPNSQSSVILGRSFSVTRNGLCVSVLLNTLDTTVSIQRGKKLGYALPMRTDYEETQKLKKYSVKDCPYHANKDRTKSAARLFVRGDE